ncbi:MAG: hypothetical protein FJ388_02625, partial [Verrucomicrobia bacterium]|nr:hypothetical protein [Verrucomicrobiota bacterium]
GKVEVLPSVWFARFTWNHNWDLPIWEEPFVPSRGTFLALTVRDGVRRVTRWLRRGWTEHELAGVKQVRCVEFRGAFPVAEVAFVDDELPARASLRAWSPLVPHNLKDSSLPVAFLELTLENPLDRPLEVSAMMSLENNMGIGGVRVHEGKQRWYFADGTLQQPAVISGSPLQGLKFRSPRRFEGIGRNVAGEYLLLTDGPTTDRGWDALGDGQGLIEDFSTDGELNGLQMSSREDKVRAAGALCRRLTLPARAKETVWFVLVWWMPDHVTLDLKNHGHYYLRGFRDSEKLAAYVFDQRQRLERETDEWARLVRDSNLPAWLKRLALNAVAPILSNSLFTRDGEFAMQENPVRAEGALGAMESRAASGALLRALFPELDRRELEMFRACQQPSGEVPRLLGNVYRGFPNTNVWRGVAGEPEPTRVFGGEVQRHAQATGDGKFASDFASCLARADLWLKNMRAALATAPPSFAGGNLDAARRAHDVIYRYHKSPWAQRGEVSLACDAPPVVADSHRNGVAPWTLLAVLTGAKLDAARHRLTLAPQLPAGMEEMRAPIFLPQFWAHLDYGPQQFRLNVVKHFGEPLELREVTAGADGAAVPLPKPFRAEAGASLDLTRWGEQLRARAREQIAATRVTAPAKLKWSRSGMGTLLWWATASSDDPWPPSDAFDGYRETRWETIVPGRMSDWFQLDLGEARQLQHMEIETTTGAQLRVEFSSDGNRWQTLAGAATVRATAWNDVWSVEWSGGAARFLKFSPARDMDRPWQISEMRVK